ncbi:putative transcription factor AP2-EREBP family [Rosa chinensis]|uniref:Putative transcription factor AP2-EREBP family n=1 Tax=Rosa chinensis TaxID=74649 RepID=A0A2P6PFP2_ROSCH|nr:ethylene-responsive transcription factor ERF020 [Rosa chinensis]PRQ20745.1 putative transcription factor AP2-EREBP family [Rosa chinensis]
MSYSSEDSSSPTTAAGNGRKLKGVRQRKWGKWVSEIRVPGKQDRLWLGSFSTAEAAAVARDVAYYCLRKPSTLEGLNFPTVLPCSVNQAADMSPRSIQKAASDAGMAVDAQLINANSNSSSQQNGRQANGSEPRVMQSDGCWEDTGESSSANTGGEALSISIEDYL